MTETCRALGRYSILAELGRGSDGIVYRASRPGGGHVALKTPLSAEERTWSGLRREYYALSRIQHPGIVRILDAGLDDAPPWYAMEVVLGTSLGAHCRAVWDPEAATYLGPISKAAVEGILTCFARLCEPLAILHGEGIVHRDLKPENVIVGADGRVTIVDLGLMAQFGGRVSREHLEVHGDIVGAPATMAPEQWRGELVDARADIFALGSMMYTVFTGRHPYAPDGLLDFGNYPPPPSTLVLGLPPELDDLVLRLIRLDAERRPGYAEDVARALRGLGGGNGTAPRRVESRPYPYRPKLIGREAAAGTLRRRLGDLDVPRGGLVILAGESGAGKTRLAMEMAREARGLGHLVLVGECDARTHDGGACAPLGPFRRPLRALGEMCREAGPDRTSRWFGARAGLLADYEPSLAGLSDGSASPPLDSKQARHYIFRCLLDTVRHAAMEQPIVMVLDDLQWADELTLGFLAFVRRERTIARFPLLILGTSRDEEKSEALEALTLRGPRFVERIDLVPLTDEEVGRMVAQMLACSEAPDALARLVRGKSGGNPFFVAEYLRSAIALGWLRRDASGQWVVPRSGKARTRGARAVPIPKAIKELMASRLLNLTPSGQVVMQAASVLGREVSEGLLVAASPLPRNETLSALTELQVRQILEPAHGGHRFLHDQIRELAYDGIESGARGELHRRVASSLEAAVEKGDMAGILGYHWEYAGQPERACAYYLAGARAAADRHALEESERLYRSCLRLLPAGSIEVTRVRVELDNRVLCQSGRAAEGIAELTRARHECAGDPKVEAEILVGLGRAHGHLADDRTASAFLRDAISTCRASGDRLGEAGAVAVIARILMRSHRSEEVVAMCERALASWGNDAPFDLLNVMGSALSNLCRPADAREYYARALDRLAPGQRAWKANLTSNLATVAWREGDLLEAERQHRESLAIHREVGNRISEINVRFSLSAIALQRGALGEARRGIRELLALEAELGIKSDVVYLMANAMFLSIEGGRFAEARRNYQRVVAMMRTVGDSRSEAVVDGNFAIVEQVQGRYRVAEELYVKAAAAHREAGNKRFEGQVLSRLGSLRREQGRLDEALDHLQQALACEREAGDRWYENRVNGDMADLMIDRQCLDEAARLCDVTFAAARQGEDVKLQGIVLFCQSRLAGHDGRQRDAESLARQAEARLRQVSDKPRLGLVACHLCHLLLAKGAWGPARRKLSRARTFARRLEVLPESHLARAITKLEEASEACGGQAGIQADREAIIEAQCAR